MSRFYGIVSGASKTQATRRGHNELETTAASWNGAVRTYLYRNDKDEDCYRVCLVPWHGMGESRVIAEGRF